MRNVSAADLVSAWERALGQPPVHQALVLLSVASPESSPEELAQLSVGQRDARLLTFRERLFGSRLISITACPRCRQRIELVFNVADIRVTPAAAHTFDPAGETMTMDGYRVQFRLPNSLDLSSMDATTDVNEAREYLLRRCIQSVAYEGAIGENVVEPVNDVRRLPMTVVNAIADRMTDADPQADTQLALRCPDCRHEWHAVFDIASYLIGEIHNSVAHVLREVHHLARAYGWRESDILAMTPTRRRAYLELLGQE
jgi:hypothetical protein